MIYFFFFQAEDGIRDSSVTGVQTCALPIFSVFIGEYLSKVLADIKERVGDKFDEQDEAILKLDLHRSIPELLLDNTDRNRTSPFSFRGNTFEFRAVASTANCANALLAPTTTLAETLKK